MLVSRAACVTKHGGSAEPRRTGNVPASCYDCGFFGFLLEGAGE